MDLKICGICYEEDLRYCNEVGIAYVGLMLIPRSPRYLPIDRSIELWQKINASSPLRCKPVLVAEGLPYAALKKVSQAWVQAIGRPPILQWQVDGPGYLDEGVVDHFEEIWMAKSVRASNDLKQLRQLNASLVLCDGPAPGSGESFDWSLIKTNEMPARWGLAGGINLENIHSAITLRPNLIDVSSSVEERPRKKDHAKIKLIWDNIQSDR